MAPEANWQASSVERAGGRDTPSSASGADHESVEALIRRLIERVEESERRYSEALDDLHARLDQLTQRTEALPTAGTLEETETLERLRSHLSSLTERLEQPKETDPGFEELAKLDKALAEAREAAAGLDIPKGAFAAPLTPASLPFPHAQPSLGLELPMPEAKSFSPSFAEPPFAAEHGDLDARLIEMANRLERSIEDTNAKGAIETLNSRMDDLAKRFEAALSRAPGSPDLSALEQQIGDIGQHVTRVEQQLRRIGLVEGELNRLIERFEGTPAQVVEAASRAANEAARIVAETGSGSLSAAERLDAIHRDLVAMNERSRVTDDRVVDTLAAVHESLKGLVHQLERGSAAIPQNPDRGAPAAETQAGRGRAGFTLPPQRPGLPPFAPESLSGRAALRDDGAQEDPRPGERSLRNRLRDALSDLESEEPAAAFGRAKRAAFDEQVFDADDTGQPSPFARTFRADEARDSIDDLVAAARRASQAAAARAEERGTQTPRPARIAKDTNLPIGMEVPERRKRSVLIIAAALLLLISAALLYSRLRSKPEPEIAPPATEQTIPAPATDAAPTAKPDAAGSAPQPEAQQVPTDVVPAIPEGSNPGAMEAPPAPNTTPDMPPAATTPDLPHPTSPSTAPGDTELPPPVRVSEAPIVLVSAGTPGSGVSEVAKSLKPQPASLGLDDEPALPPGMSFAAGAPRPEVGTDAPVPSRLPLPDAEIGPLPLREAAAAGDPRAQYIVGLRYAQGGNEDARPNWEGAARWFALAASAGLAPAQYRLAVLYERGDGVAKDLGLAKSWYQRAAEQGNVKAMHNLAVAVSRESGNADYALAAKWYEEAASYGLADSQFNLGVLAEHGLGIEKDLAAAYRWFALAASSTRDPEAVRRRNSLKAALSIVGAAEADAAVRAWKAKPAKLEANQVADLDTWREVPAVADKDLIVRAQTLLNTLGYEAGPADGEAGTRTQEAIKAFELRNGLDQTGEVTPPLVSKLQQLAG